MVDETKPDDATKAAAEGLKKILDALAPEPKAEVPPSPSAPVDEVYGAIGAADVSASAQQAVAAVERYRNAMRWLVAAVAAVGAALFGSVALTEGELDGTRLVGLGAAATGLVLILWGATLVFEPEDASLGELVEDFAKDSYGETNDDGTVRPGRRRWPRGVDWLRWTRLRRLHPRWRAIHRLRTMVEVREVSAHLGPDVATVADLLTEIGDLERRRRDTAPDVVRCRRLLAADTERRTAAEGQLKALVDLRAAAEKVSGTPTEPIDTAIAAASRATVAAREDEDRKRSDLADAVGSLANVDIPLGRHMLHRSVLLDESAVAQVRGTFRASRPMLLVGAAVTLVGALVYVTSVKEEDPVYAWPGTLRVAADTTTAESFPAPCVDEDLQVVLFSDEVPSLAEQYAIAVGAPEECAGTYTIPANRGRADAELDVGRRVAVPDSDAPAGDDTDLGDESEDDEDD